VGGRVFDDQQGWSATPVPMGDFACAGQQGWPATLLALRVGAHPLVGGRVFDDQQGWSATLAPMDDFACDGQRGLACYPPWR
jgi:hypothetical protein